MGLLSWFGIAIVCGVAAKAPRELSIVETAQATPDLSQLVDALVQTNLVDALAGPGPFTVFAPTNDAFEAISSVVAGLTTQQLAEVLEYHVIAGVAAKSTELSEMQVLLPLLTQKSLHVHIRKNGDIRIVGEKNFVTVTTADVVCSNGVVHIVDAVLVPNVTPAPPAAEDSVLLTGDTCAVGDAVACAGAANARCGGNQCCPDGSICPSADHSFSNCPLPKTVDCTATATMSIVETASATPDLSTLVSALGSADLVGALSGEGPFTVFAPTNAAFAAISSVVDGLTMEQLAEVLEYHVVAGIAVKASDLSDMQVLLPLFSGHSLGINLEEWPAVRIVGEKNAVTVTMADVVCTNGVVHIVDAVLLPYVTPAPPAPEPAPAPATMSIVETASATPALSTLVSVLVSADLVGALSGEGPFTVFAPTNSAFAAIQSVVDGLTIDQLAQVLEYHVVAGVAAKASDLSNMQVLQPLFSNHSLQVDLWDLPTVRIVAETGVVATVTMADVVCTNGVVHIVDAVLVPSLAIFISV